MRFFINPIPCIPFPLARGRGEIISLEGLRPSKTPPSIQRKESQREVKPLLHIISPLMQGRYSYHGEGDKGGEVDKTFYESY